MSIHPDSYARPQSRVDAAVVREIVAALLLILGAAGLVTAGFMVTPALGVAVASVAVIATGVALGIER